MRIIASIIVCLLFSNSAFALTTKWYICDSCSYLQEKSKAETNAPSDPISDAYTIDLDNKTITKWLVTTENNQHSAGSVALDSTTNTKFNAYKTVLEDAEVPFSISDTGSSSGFDSAFQLIGSSEDLADLYDWFEDNHFDAFDWDPSHFSNVAYSMKTRVSSEFTQVTINFADDSMLRVDAVNWDWTNSGLEFEYNYAEDENGDEIPLDPADYNHDDWVNDSLGDYLDENGYSPFFPTGGSFLVSGTGQYKLISCNRIIFECEVEEDQ